MKDEHWLNDVLDRGAYVYRHDDQWLTARAIFDVGAISEPDELRVLIEAVHGPDAPQVPEPLERAQIEHDGAILGDTALAQQNVVVPEDGYLKGTKGGVWSDERYPTRLGAEEATLVLARREADGLLPWWSHEEGPVRAWTLSEVRCNRNRLPAALPDQSAEDIALLKASWPRGKRDYLTVCPVSEDGVICAGLRYDPQWGLTFT